jgi:hypothetical protein
MNYLTHSLLLHQLVSLFESRVCGFVEVHPVDIVCYTVESPPRKDQLVPALGILAHHSEYESTMLVQYFKFLVVFDPAATVQNRSLSYFANEFLLVSHIDCWSVVWTAAEICLPHSLIRHVLIVVFPDYLPRPVRSRTQDTQNKRHGLLKHQVDVSLLLISLISR